MYFINKEVMEYLARTLGGTEVGWCMFLDTMIIFAITITLVFLFREKGGKDDNQ